MQEWVFSAEVAMDEETKGEVIRIEAQEGQGSPYILMLTHKILANCFRLYFSTRLGSEWSNLGLKGILSNSRKPSISLYLLTSHCNPRFLKIMDGRRLSTRHSPNIVASPICPFLLLHLLTLFPKIPLTTHQYNPPMLARDWKMMPTMSLTKKNPLLPLPHPPMDLTNMCLPRCIWGTIVPTWSTRLGLRAQCIQRQIQENRRSTTKIKERLHRRVRNMVFDFYFVYYWWQLTSRIFGQNVLFWIYE